MVDFRLRAYQQALAAEVLADLEAKTPEVLLAACPGFGKTEVALWLIGQLIATKQVKRVLVLAHGTTVLRENFSERLRLRRPDLLLDVHVAIPHEWRKLRDVEYPVVVVDEAHQFYEAGEGGLVDRVLKQVKAKQVLLLSGSPARFIRRALKPHAFALDELFQVDGGRWVSDIRVDLALSAYEIRERDWNATGEVRDRVRYKQAQTDRTLDRLMTALGPRLKVGKEATLIACKSIKMADQVAAFFGRRGIACAVSHSDGDRESAAVKAFRDGETNLLVVVARATLGFDYPEMRNFIDLTGSRNPDRIFQMMCRLARPAAGKPEKTYVKVMPKAFSGRDLRLFMTGVCALKYRDLYTTWDGGSFYKLRVPVDRTGEPRPVDAEQAGRKRPEFESAMMLFGDGFQGTQDESGRLATTSLGRLAAVRVGPLEIAIHGRTMSATEWAREMGLEPTLVLTRHNRGIRGAALIAPVASRKPIAVTIDGRTQSLEGWASETGVPKITLYFRHRRGERGSHLLRPPAATQSGTVLTIGGKTQKLAEWARRARLNRNTIRKRLSSGVTGSALLKPPSKPSTRRPRPS